MRIHRSRQQLYGMNERHVQTALATPSGDLQEASGVRGRHDLRPRLDNTSDLELEQLAGHAGLEQVVDAGAAAAEVAVGELHELEPRDPPEQLARLLPHPLTVSQVAGVVIRHGEVEPPERQL